MKRIKHLITVILILAVAILPTGCGEETPEPAEFLNTVFENYKETMSFQGTAEMMFETTYSGQTMSYEMNMDMGLDFNDIENPKMAIDLTTSMTGMTVDMSMYYNDGYSYVDVLGMKIKQESPVDMLEDYYDFSLSIPEIAYIVDVTMTEEGDNYLLTYSVNEEEQNEILNDMMSSMGEEFDVDTMTESIEYTKLSNSILADKDGNIISQDIVMEVTITMDGESMDMSLTGSMDYKALGEDVVIEFPDFSDYVESDISSSF